MHNGGTCNMLYNTTLSPDIKKKRRDRGNPMIMTVSFSLSLSGFFPFLFFCFFAALSSGGCLVWPFGHRQQQQSAVNYDHYYPIQEAVSQFTTRATPFSFLVFRFFILKFQICLSFSIQWDWQMVRHTSLHTWMNWLCNTLYVGGRETFHNHRSLFLLMKKID